jgi:hypothetical protein
MKFNAHPPNQLCPWLCTPSLRYHDNRKAAYGVCTTCSAGSVSSDDRASCKLCSDTDAIDGGPGKVEVGGVCVTV